MSKRVFVSYSHRQGQWVWERLVPILRAAGSVEVLIDRERIRAGCGIKGQMNAMQDQVDVSLLVLTPDYLASDYCRHEMARALAADPDFQHDKGPPVKRTDCDLSAFHRANNPPLWVDLANDTDPAPCADVEIARRHATEHRRAALAGRGQGTFPQSGVELSL